MMRGIVYYNRGTKCLIRLLVSRYTLQRSGYTGAVVLLSEDDPPAWFCERWNDPVVRIPDDCFAPYPLVQKTSLWRYSPFEASVYIDSDTAVLADPSPLFDETERFGYMVTAFSDWTPRGGTMRRRIESWRPVAGDSVTDDALKYSSGVNTGVFGWCGGNAFLPAWENITYDGYVYSKAHEDSGPRIRLIDETACQVLVPQYDHALVSSEWNHSVKHDRRALKDAKIIHYHGSKHVHDFPTSAVWKKAYTEMVEADDFPELRQPHGDKRLGQWLDKIGWHADVSPV